MARQQRVIISRSSGTLPAIAPCTPKPSDDASRQVPQYRTEAQPLEYRDGNDRRRQQDQYVCKVMGFRHDTTSISATRSLSITFYI
ncbi:MAG: hypothetical protein OEU91_11145 [Gammaproteobacteria bacterium]|nr:hypothetical protein [Gammaproteobacteria bacterium]